MRNDFSWDNIRIYLTKLTIYPVLINAQITRWYPAIIWEGFIGEMIPGSGRVRVYWLFEVSRIGIYRDPVDGGNHTLEQKLLVYLS